MLVVPPPSQRTCCRHRPVQVPVPPSVAGPQRLGTPPPPQICPLGQVPQFAVRPPQPLLCCPQVFAGHPRGWHTVPPPSGKFPPQRLGTPAPPQRWPAGHVVEQETTPPQPFAIGPQSPGAHVVLVRT